MNGLPLDSIRCDLYNKSKYRLFEELIGVSGCRFLGLEQAANQCFLVLARDH